MLSTRASATRRTDIPKERQNCASSIILVYAAVVKLTGTRPTAFADTASLLLNEMATIFHNGRRQTNASMMTMA